MGFIATTDELVTYCRNHAGEQRPCRLCYQWRQDRKARLIAAGLCIKCGAFPVKTGRKRCVACCEQIAAKAKTRARGLKAEGLCALCGGVRVSGRTLCAKHLQGMRDASNKRTKERTAAGLCVQCGQPSPFGQARCLLHRKTKTDLPPQPVRRALREAREATAQAERDSLARATREFVERHLHLVRAPRTKAILQMRYGWNKATCHTLQEVADVFGVTRERIRQIQCFAEERIQMFTIEKNVPLEGQPRQEWAELRETLSQMDVGDSFVMPKVSKSHHARVTQVGRSMGLLVTTRTVSDAEIRVWLVSKKHDGEKAA